MSVLIENENEKIVVEPFAEYTQMKKEMKEVIKGLKKAKYESDKSLFRAQFSYAKAAFNKMNEGKLEFEQIVLDFMYYIIADYDCTLGLWHPMGGIIHNLYRICKRLMEGEDRLMRNAATRIMDKIQEILDWYDEKYEPLDLDRE